MFNGLKHKSRICKENIKKWILSGGFADPYGRQGDSFCVQESFYVGKFDESTYTVV